jgi:hypothetical protein
MVEDQRHQGCHDGTAGVEAQRECMRSWWLGNYGDVVVMTSLPKMQLDIEAMEERWWVISWGDGDEQPGREAGEDGNDLVVVVVIILE